MKVLFDLEGKTHKGTVEVEGKEIFICQNVLDGVVCKNKRGYKYSYALCYPNGTNFLGECYNALTNIRPDPEAYKETPVKKYSFETVFKLNGESFDITTHREKIKRMSAELKELKAIERAFLKYQRGAEK